MARVAAGRRERREQSEQRSDHAALHNHSFYSESESERSLFSSGTDVDAGHSSEISGDSRRRA